MFKRQDHLTCAFCDAKLRDRPAVMDIAAAESAATSNVPFSSGKIGKKHLCKNCKLDLQSLIRF